MVKQIEITVTTDLLGKGTAKYTTTFTEADIEAVMHKLNGKDIPMEVLLKELYEDWRVKNNIKL